MKLNKHTNTMMRNASRIAVLAAVLMIAGTAHAVGWTAAATNITEFGNALVLAIVVLCAAGGVGAIGYAGKLLLKKSGERGDDVEWSKIGYATLAGAFLLSVAFIAGTTVETLGGDKDKIGETIKKIG